MDPTDLSDDQLDKLAQQLAGRLPTGTHGDRVVLSRRQALAVASGTVSLGALLGLGSDSALAQASADTSDGIVRGNGGGADVYLDQLRDPGGDEVLNVDDTGAINAQPREWVFDLVSTEKIGTERHLAGAYSGSDADARLDAAISAASDNDIIYLETNEYAASRTISKSLTLVGTNTHTNSSGTRFTGDLTLDDLCVLKNSGIAQSTLTINSRSRVENVNLGGSASITVASDQTILSEIAFGSVTFESGTSNGIIDGSMSVSVTDNGSNTVGDIS